MSCTKCKRPAKATDIYGITRMPDGSLLHNTSDGCVEALMCHVAQLDEENGILLKCSEKLAGEVEMAEARYKDLSREYDEMQEELYPMSADGRE